MKKIIIGLLVVLYLAQLSSVIYFRFVPIVMTTHVDKEYSLHHGYGFPGELFPGATAYWAIPHLIGGCQNVYLVIDGEKVEHYEMPEDVHKDYPELWPDEFKK